MIGIAAADDELARTRRALDVTRADLDAAIASHKAFAYSVSHDLRAPLRAIAGFATMLEESLNGTAGDEARRFLTVIGDNARAMNAQLDALLTLSRLAHRDLRPATVDMVAAARAAVCAAEAGAPERTVLVEIAPLVPTSADPELVEQVFTELLGNAWKFTRHRPDATVEIGCTAGPVENVYFVRDNGAGFAPAGAGRLFTVFRRLHRQDEYEGLGVGLAIVRTVVTRHHGRVWAECVPGESTTFSFSLPRQDLRANALGV